MASWGHIASVSVILPFSVPEQGLSAFYLFIYFCKFCIRWSGSESRFSTDWYQNYDISQLAHYSTVDAVVSNYVTPCAVDMFHFTYQQFPLRLNPVWWTPSAILFLTPYPFIPSLCLTPATFFFFFIPSSLLCTSPLFYLCLRRRIVVDFTYTLQ
jgi:hypothetical protein